MSHLPLSSMNRLNKTESAIFQLWMLYFQKILFFRLYIPRHIILPVTKDRLSSLLKTQNDINFGLAKTSVKP